MRGDLERSLHARRRDSVSLALALAHVAFVFAPLYAAAWTGPSALLVPYCIAFGSTMHGLLNLMHEAAHHHVFRARWASDLLGRWVLGPLVLADFDAYRRRHWQHHRELGGPNDTKYTYRMDLRPPALLRFVARCFLLAEAWERFSHVRRVGGADPGAGSATGGLPRWVVRVGIVQLGLATSLVAVAWLGAETLPEAILSAAAAYAVVYVYGLGAITSLVAGIRSVAEHQIGPDDVERSGVAALRNLRCNALTRLLLGAYGFGEHATHHASPGIPSYHLARATREMAEGDPRLVPRYGYLELVRLLVRNAAAERPA